MNMPGMNQIIICGLDSAGKTTILRFIESGEFVQTARTMGFNVNSIMIRDLSIRVFDMGGQESFRSMWKEHLPLAKAIVFVIDSALPERFDEAKQEFQENVLAHAQKDTPILILTNKQDLEEASPSIDVVKALGIYGNERHYDVIETSAVTSEGLFEAGVWIYEKITNSAYPKPDPFEGLI